MKLNDKPIGALNGPWALLLKLNLIIMPILLTGLITLNVWFVRSIHAHDVRLATFEEWKNIGPRFLQKDAELLKLEIQRWHIDDLEKHGLLHKPNP